MNNNTINIIIQHYYSSAGTVTRPWVRQPNNWGLILNGGRNCSPFLSVQNGSGAHLVSYSMHTKGSSSKHNAAEVQRWPLIIIIWWC